jgi:Sec-independent protein secretion pathway component TatC
VPSQVDRPDPDDFFADTRMSIGDHIEELRAHLLRAIAGFLVGLVFGFFLGRPVMLLIAAPVESRLMKFYSDRVERKRRELEEQQSEILRYDKPQEVEIWLPRNLFPDAAAPAEGADGKWLKVPARIPPVQFAIATDMANRIVSRPPTLAAFSVTETLLVWLKVSMACGVILASPYIFWQLWSFVAAGLYPRERRQVYSYLPGSIFLFLAGVAFCELIVLPAAVSYLRRRVRDAAGYVCAQPRGHRRGGRLPKTPPHGVLPLGNSRRLHRRHSGRRGHGRDRHPALLPLRIRHPLVPLVPAAKVGIRGGRARRGLSRGVTGRISGSFGEDTSYCSGNNRRPDGAPVGG